MARESCHTPLQPDDPFQTPKCDLLLTPGPPQDGEAERLQQGWRRCAEAETNRGPHPVVLLFDPAECCPLVVVVCHGPAAPLPAVPPAKGGASRLVFGLRLWSKFGFDDHQDMAREGATGFWREWIIWANWSDTLLIWAAGCGPGRSENA